MIFPTDAEIAEKQKKIIDALTRWLVYHPNGGIFTSGNYQFKITPKKKEDEKQSELF